MVGNSEEPSQNPVEIRRPGGRITLRQFRPSDAREAFALIDRNRDHLSQLGDDTASNYPTYESVLDNIVNPKKPKRLRFAVRNSEGLYLGTINLTPDEDNLYRGEVGYYIGSEFQGKGYTTEATQLLSSYAFNTLHYDELYAKVHSERKASQKILTKSGYKENGMIKGSILFTLTKQG